MSKRLAVIYLHVFGLTFFYIYIAALTVGKIFPINFWVLGVVVAIYLALISLFRVMN